MLLDLRSSSGDGVADEESRDDSLLKKYRLPLGPIISFAESRRGSVGKSVLRSEGSILINLIVK